MVYNMIYLVAFEAVLRVNWVIVFLNIYCLMISTMYPCQDCLLDAGHSGKKKSVATEVSDSSSSIGLWGSNKLKLDSVSWLLFFCD